jgi:hypothetical protein
LHDIGFPKDLAVIGSKAIDVTVVIAEDEFSISEC